jgi:hypothetical protein
MRTRRGLSLGFVICALLLSSSAAFGVECRNLLVPDFALPGADPALDLTYLSIIEPESFDAHQQNSYVRLIDTGPRSAPRRSGGIKLPIAGPLLHASATYADLASKREQTFAQYRFEHTAADLAAFYRHLLPAQRFTAYARCSDVRDTQARIVLADHDFIKLVFDEDFVSSANADVAQFSVSGADLQGSTPAHIERNGSAWLFVRHQNQDFRVAATVGSAPLQVFVPRYIAAAPEPSPASARCASADKVGQALYRQLLARSATPTELAHMAARLHDGTNTVQQLAEQVALSGEFEKKFVQGKSQEGALGELYRRVLAREADADGLAYHVRALRGIKPAHLATEYFRNVEYTQRFGEWIVPGPAPLIRYCAK